LLGIMPQRNAMLRTSGKLWTLAILIAILAVLCVHPVLSQGQTPSPVVIPAKSCYLLEIEPDDKAALVLVDPPNTTFKFFAPSSLFVESASVKGGVIRVLQVSPGDSPTAPKVRWYSWTVQLTKAS
jgi:hypothetical protein